MSNLDQLTKLVELKEKGILTEEEFQIEKAKILNSDKPTNINAAAKIEEPKKASMFDKLQPCKACKKEVSVEAKRCPNCGEKNPTMTTGKYAVGCLVFIVIAIIIAMCSHESKDNQEPTPAASPTPTEQISDRTMVDVDHTLDITFSQFKAAFNKQAKKIGASEFALTNNVADTSQVMGMSFYEYKNVFGSLGIRVNKSNNKVIDIIITGSTDGSKQSMSELLGFVIVCLDSASKEVSKGEALGTMSSLMSKLSPKNPHPSAYIDGVELSLAGNFSTTDKADVLIFSISRMK